MICRMTKENVNIVSVSGGKDSAATLALAMRYDVPNLHAVFADTGHEREETYVYVNYLSDLLKAHNGREINVVKAEFSKQIAHKRTVVDTKWRKDFEAEGMQPELIEKRIQVALSVLQPTGNPFLDLCLWKGRFPSTRRRFCSQELKHVPIDKYMQPFFGEYKAVISWQGVRADESADRKDLLEYDIDFGSWEPIPSGSLIYRPIISWTAARVFEFLKESGVAFNPLYTQGMGRVGCMPCIHATKQETRAIDQRFPEDIERVDRWEKLVSKASKRGVSTFMDARVTARYLGTGTTVEDISTETHGIKTYVNWSKTKHGGRYYDLIPVRDLDRPQTCQSKYGLCE